MIRAVIDTNVFVSALWTNNPDSPPMRIYRAVTDGKIVPVYCEKIIAEYEDVLFRKKFGFRLDSIVTLIDTIRTNGYEVEPAESGELFPDPDDRVFYCAALAARSAGCLLVTGNARHFPAAPFVVSPAKLAGLL